MGCLCLNYTRCGCMGKEMQHRHFRRKKADLGRPDWMNVREYDKLLLH